MGDRSRVYHLRIRPSHPDQVSLAISLWLGKMSAGSGYGHRYGRNGELCACPQKYALLSGLLAYQASGLNKADHPADLGRVPA